MNRRELFGAVAGLAFAPALPRGIESIFAMIEKRAREANVQIWAAGSAVIVEFNHSGWCVGPCTRIKETT
jgi:hypothetical protein